MPAIWHKQKASDENSGPDPSLQSLSKVMSSNLSMSPKALIIACKDGRLVEARALIEQGADVNDADHDGRKPLYEAARKVSFWLLLIYQI